jgi:hypothetical protein
LWRTVPHREVQGIKTRQIVPLLQRLRRPPATTRKNRGAHKQIKPHAHNRHEPTETTQPKKDMKMTDLFNKEPRDYALEMVESGLASADHLLLCALKYMSHDDVRDMLDANELSPRFTEDE